MKALGIASGFGGLGFRVWESPCHARILRPDSPTTRCLLILASPRLLPFFFLGSHIQTRKKKAPFFFRGQCRQRPLGNLFVDLREAFHRVVRPMMHGGAFDQQLLAGVMKELDLRPDVLHRLWSHARDSSLIEQRGASNWTARLIRELGADVAYLPWEG